MGRLVPVKGLDLFLNAARQIRDRRQDVKFVIAGDGPLRDSLRTMARQLDLEDDVLFLGHRDDNCNTLALMDVFLLPSLSEGVPMALLEALALSRPVVASRVGGVPEVIEHDVSGILIDPGQPDELVRGCLALVDDRGRAERLGIAGRKRIEQRFSADAMAASVMEVYRALVRKERAQNDCVQRGGLGPLPGASIGENRGEVGARPWRT
jgi:glycosyltransferase involved in cell wall biosynthesis